MSNPWEFMWEILPPGFRFHPTDEEFVNHYLTNYILGKKDHFDVIPIVDDLFKRDPSELPPLFRGSSIIKSRDPEWWFLSTLRYKSANADKFDRRTSKGSWKITGVPKKIHQRGVNRLIAEMRNVVFCDNQRNEETSWVIHEYYLKDISFHLTLREQRKYVLCHLVNRQYDYPETSMNMEVDFEFEEQGHEFPEEIIQAKIRSLQEGPWSPATNAPLQNRQETREAMFCFTEYAMSTSSGDKDDIGDLLDCIAFSTDEESARSDEFEVESFYEQLLEPEETSGAASNHVVLNKNRQARPLGTIEGYVAIDETRGFVEADFQREEAGDVLSLTDSPKTPPTKYPMASPKEHSVCYTPPGRHHNFKEGKVKGEQIAGTEPRSLTREVRRNPSTRPITSCEKNQVSGGCRPPFDYLVNLGAGIVLLVLMILWLLRY